MAYKFYAVRCVVNLGGVFGWMLRGVILMELIELMKNRVNEARLGEGEATIRVVGNTNAEKVFYVSSSSMRKDSFRD